VILVQAELSDLPRLLKFRTDAAAWLAPLGSDQWSTEFPADHVARSIQNREVFIVRETKNADAAATITVDADADPLLWTTKERAESALYVHKLTVDRKYASLNLGTQLLDWAGNRTIQLGAQWLRLDAWTTNARLHRYYLDRGFAHVRTVHGPEVGGSGWVAQRPARQTFQNIDDHTNPALDGRV
jgi:GNAT superfamily N-acetyltransferase